MTTDDIFRVVDLIVEATDAQRRAMLGELWAKVCLYCGNLQPNHGPQCQCWNDHSGLSPSETTYIT